MTTACFLGCARCNTQCVGRRHGRQRTLFFISLIHLRTSPQKTLAGRTYSTMTAGPTGSRSIRVQAKGKGKGKGKGSLLQRSTNHSSWQCCQNEFPSRRRNPPGGSGSNYDKVPCKKMCTRSKHIRKELNQTYNFNRNIAPSPTLFLFFRRALLLAKFDNLAKQSNSI